MKKILLLLLLSLLPALASAHPHVFINGTLSFSFDNTRLTGIRVSWEFDPMFSSQVITACDENKNRKFDAIENGKVRSGFFKNLKNFDYFTRVWINNVFKRTTAVTGFRATINKESVTFQFFIPLNQTVSKDETSVKVAFIDDSNFVAFTSPSQGITIKGNRPAKVNFGNNRAAQYQIRFHS